MTADDARLTRSQLRSLRSGVRRGRRWYRRRGWWTALIVTVLGAAAGAAVAAGPGPRPTAGTRRPSRSARSSRPARARSSDPTTTSPPTTLPTVGEGAPVQDGAFRFTVTGVTCGISRIGSAGSGVRPNGQFCEVALTVQDVAAQAQVFDADVQSAFDGSVRYGISPYGQLALFDLRGDTFTVDPGGVLKAMLAFDIPTAARLTSLELRDARGAPGVSVVLP